MLRVQNLMILTWLFVAVHSADIILIPNQPLSHTNLSSSFSQLIIYQHLTYSFTKKMITNQIKIDLLYLSLQ